MAGKAKDGMSTLRRQELRLTREALSRDQWKSEIDEDAVRIGRERERQLIGEAERARDQRGKQVPLAGNLPMGKEKNEAQD